MKHITTVLCARALIDQTTSSLSMIETIDSVLTAPNLTGQGMLPFPVDLVSLWARSKEDEPETSRARVMVFAPDNTSFAEPLIYEADLRSSTRARNLTKFPGFPIKGTGLHRFVVEVERDEDEWELVAEWPVVVSAPHLPRPSD